MDMVAFHKLRLAVQQNGHPAGGAALAGLQRALDEALSQSRLFAEVELGRTDDPDRMVIGLGHCADGILPWEAGIGLERLWHAVVADARWEAHHVGCTESLLEFEGAVTIDDSGHFMTVHLVAEAAVPAVPEPVSAATSSVRED